jgi:hypothetical protein
VKVVPLEIARELCLRRRKTGKKDSTENSIYFSVLKVFLKKIIFFKLNFFSIFRLF